MRAIRRIKVQDGCWLAIRQGVNTESFLEFTGFNETNALGNLPTLLFEWEIVGDTITPLQFFSFRGMRALGASLSDEWERAPRETHRQ